MSAKAGDGIGCWPPVGERTAEAKLEAVRAVHEKVRIPGSLGSLANWTWCRHCGSRWPCATIYAIDGDEGEDD